ncbi:hypothetical protein HRR83_007143 [Exophiala dermatitidis]|nr:hypothetical protein HRR75_006142 [Exophiala dermatitidis]KAJ4511104.1 hypothetical protein HRR73_006435 [Exophiala dermatitidis]KAJ4511961.1 hypothetical protein HRR74_006697 [Exophiala dermatitidis]KAJ4534824.1 hypothetical protein HRR76_006733 [Exophiala dermatitidis]KAJ4545797.1 hypothetical protein HRR78_006073 [Exophiala dermatitidis]
MSTNPFRQTNRSSLKGPGGGGSSSTSNFSTSDPHGNGPAPLSLNTKVPATSQKHVNFASPPAIPISPVSYPPSPESARHDFSSPFPSPGMGFPAQPDYSQALGMDPFANETSDGEDDRVIEVALENARVNTSITVSTSTSLNNPEQDAVRDTLGRFAGVPRRPTSENPPVGGPSGSSIGRERSGSTKAAMDVDAFKRLLLTGERGTPSSAAAEAAVQNTHTGVMPTVSDSGSSADTASISQHSIFETVVPLPEASPRTSDDLEEHQANEQRATMGSASETRKKPPPPKSRRGKPLRDSRGESGPTPTFDSFINSLSMPSSRHVSSEPSGLTSPTTDRSTTKEPSSPTAETEVHRRTPPAPPLARRKSMQASSNPGLTRSGSSKDSTLKELETPSSPVVPSTTHKLPPPPPSRRSTGATERKSSMEVSSFAEAINNPDVQHQERPSATESEHETPSSNSLLSRRLSHPHPPPVPPPRRGRGSSRSSVENQRPSMAALGAAEHGGTGSSLRRSSTEGRDILADLAALQREVDAARASAEGG